MIQRLERMPVPVLPTFVGALTLANVYAGLGYPVIRHLTMFAATVIWLLYGVKILCYPKTCQKEYQTVVPCSLYAAFCMVLMILGSYYSEMLPGAGKVIWGAGVILHLAHILVFTYRNVIRQRDVSTFVPSWFVTYNGIMVSCVVGSGMGVNHLLKYIVYYGIIIYIILIPLMIWRLCRVEVKDGVYHTMAVVLAPCSLCLVSYLNVIQTPDRNMVYFLYFCVLASLAFVIVKLPAFFSYSFSPGFAGMTFPMAIGIVASNKMSGYLQNTVGNESLAAAVTGLAGIQIYLTSMIVGYVLLNLVIMALGRKRR